jgi:hypothetical protein
MGHSNIVKLCATFPTTFSKNKWHYLISLGFEIGDHWALSDDKSMILGVVTHDDFALGWLVVASSTLQLPFMVEKVYSWGKGT